jgi:uroporphyrinogen decarboxylase
LADMEPTLLKQRFGDRLVFWGGMDVQQFLPKAKPREVAVQVDELLSTLGEDGGYIMAPAHEIQDDVPPENILAWIDVLHGNSQAVGGDG